MLALTSIAFGLLVEDMGSRIEASRFDKQLVKKPEFSHHDEEWDQHRTPWGSGTSERSC